MKIGFLTADLTHHHGWAHTGTSLIRALHRNGVETRVITTTNSPIQNGIEAYPLLPSVTPFQDNLLARMLWQLPRIRRLLADCDVIHAMVEHFAPLAVLIAGKRPVFVTVHGSYAHLPRIRRWPVNRLYQWAFQRAHLICVSNYTEQVVQRILPDAETSVVQNGVDIERFKTLPHKETKRPTILATGGIKARKGTLQLVRAMSTVREAIPDVHCIIAGSLKAEPNYVEQVRQLIAEKQLEGCVELLGFVDEDSLLEWYGSADIFALPSMNAGWKFEGFGLVYLEASAAGLPVIGTRNCGAEDAIEHDVTGLLVDQEAVDSQLPQAIIDLLNNPERARAMGAAGKRKAQGQTWDHAAEKTILLYRGD